MSDDDHGHRPLAFLVTINNKITVIVMVLRVKLEIVPLGDEGRIREIGRLDIFNRGCPEAGDGQTKCFYGVIELTPKEGGLHKEPIYHYRQDGAWKLVAKVLTHLGIGGP